MLTNKVPLWVVALIVAGLGAADLLSVYRINSYAKDAVKQSQGAYRNRGFVEGCMDALIASGRTDRDDPMVQTWTDWCVRAATRK